MKCHFIAFGGPTKTNIEEKWSPNPDNSWYFDGHKTIVKDYHGAVERIVEQARSFNIFDEIHGYTEEDLKQDTEFWEKTWFFH